MMRAVCFIACLSTAADAMARALGVPRQLVYPEGFSWIWWCSVASFTACAFIVAMKGVR